MNLARFLVTSALVLTAVAVAFAQEKPAFTLPVDPEAVIISLDDQGGGSRVVAGCEPTITVPKLAIRSGGRATFTASSVCATLIAERFLSPVETQDLLLFAILDQEFFRFSADAARAAIESEKQRTGRGYLIGDANTTVIRIKLAEREQEASYYALGFWAWAYPMVKELGQLLAVDTRLRSVVDELRTGLKDFGDAALVEANRSLKQQRPDLPALGVLDHRRTVASIDGRRTAEFVRDLKDGTALSVVVDTRSGDPARTTIQITKGN